MRDFKWLIRHRFQSVSRREFDWVVIFEKDVRLVIACLWRFVDSGKIRITSEDDGHQFGLPAPADAAGEVNHVLAHATVGAVELRHGTLNLEIQFSSGHVFQVIPDSAGYEAWILSDGDRQFVAVGGGDLAIFDGHAPNG
jgi:hypothetical protein